MIQKDSENQRVIDDLRGFKSEASRIGGPPPVATGKRAREDDVGEGLGSIPPPVKRADAWNDFEKMLKGDYARSNYGVDMP